MTRRFFFFRSEFRFYFSILINETGLFLIPSHLTIKGDLVKFFGVGNKMRKLFNGYDRFIAPEIESIDKISPLSFDRHDLYKTKQRSFNYFDVFLPFGLKFLFPAFGIFFNYLHDTEFKSRSTKDSNS